MGCILLCMQVNDKLVCILDGCGSFKEDLRSSWPNSQHCACTEGRGKRDEEAEKREGKRGWGGQERIAQSVQGHHNPSPEESGPKQMSDLTAFGFYSSY